MHLDVLVLGGGPAGCATALCLARQGHRVAIVERTHYEAMRIGESLSPGAAGLLDQLGVRQAFEAAGHLPAYGQAGCWGSAQRVERDFLFSPYGAGWHLDRRRFDADLAEAAERAGAPVWRGTRLDALERDGRGWRARLRTPVGPLEVAATWVVDASGRAQVLSRRFEARRTLHDHLVGLHATFELGSEPADTFTLVEAVSEGWFYSARTPTPQGRDIWWVALMLDADLAHARGLRDPAAWWRWLQHAPQTQQRLAGHAPPRQIGVAAAHSARLTRAHGKGWMAVGDAAASHDPLSSSGIVRALDGGIRTAGALNALLRGQTTQAEAALQSLAQRHEGDYARYLATRAQYYGMEQRWPDSEFWRRRQRWVALDPGSRLLAVGSAPQPVAWPSELAPLRPESLLAACQQPRSAAEIVAQHAQRQQVGDLRIILGLQWLLQTRSLALAAA